MILKDVSPNEMKSLIQAKVAFAVVDPSGSKPIYERLQSLPQGQAVSLFTGSLFAGHAEIAPWLIALDEPTLTWITDELCAGPWGIFVFARISLPELLQHLSRFLPATLPDGNVVLFRFYDPRVLRIFLASDAATACGFWANVIAYALGEESGVKRVQEPKNLASAPLQTAGLELSPSLLADLSKLQVKDFIVRCSTYLKNIGFALPEDPDAFFASFFHYAAESGINVEIDLVRFVMLVLGWKAMRTFQPARDILKYPDLSGSEKVSMLFELVAFGDVHEVGITDKAIDSEAKTEAYKHLHQRYWQDERFVQLHPDGMLTLDPADAAWRKEWLGLYNAHLALKAKVTDAVLDSVPL